VDTLLASAVRTIYLAPGVEIQGILSTLSEVNVKVLGGNQVGENRPSGWVAAVVPDPGPPLIEIWPGLVEGQGGVEVPLPFAIQQVNPENLSPGRLRLVESLIADLESGLTDTGVDPLTGEPR
jgi:hypothetical protein